MEPNNNINLYEILKGHEGETFYSSVFGNIMLKEITKDKKYPLRFVIDIIGEVCNTYFTKFGQLHQNIGESVIFPSKDQRDWNKWIEEQKTKVPKTWSEYINIHRYEFNKGVGDYCIDVIGHNNNGWTRRNTPIEKSALALLKIHQLIEVGYAGNVTNEEWRNIDKYKYIISTTLHVESKLHFCSKNHIAFHTKEQAEEFLSKPENIQLLKDYFMI